MLRKKRNSKDCASRLNIPLEGPAEENKRCAKKDIAQIARITMRIIPRDSVLDADYAPIYQLYPHAKTHPRLQAKRHNARWNMCKSILPIDASNPDTQKQTLYHATYTRNHQSARWNMRKSIM